MSVKSPLFNVILGSILACLFVCLAVAVAFLLWVHNRAHYSSFGPGVSRDQDLIAIFHAHRPEFEKLQQMAAEDVGHGWYLGISETNKINESRLQEYKQLTSEIRPGLDVTMDGYGDGMRFIFMGSGTSAVGPGWVKGIEYVPESQEANGAIYGSAEINGTNYQQQWQGVVSTNLDNAQTLPANVYLRPIESKWFIFYQRSD
jgi:hypothetical protein